MLAELQTQEGWDIFFFALKFVKLYSPRNKSFFPKNDQENEILLWKPSLSGPFLFVTMTMSIKTLNAAIQLISNHFADSRFSH